MSDKAIPVRGHGTNFADKRWSLGRFSLLAEQKSHGIWFLVFF
jgi:hypothetical protein